MIALKRRQLGKEASGEDARIAAYAAVSHRNDAVGMLPEKRDLRADALAPQQRLVGDLIADGVTVRHGLGAEFDGVARAPFGKRVDQNLKAKALCEVEDLVVLRNDGHAGKFLPRHSLQRVFDEHFAIYLGGELVRAEAARISGGHDKAADGGRLVHEGPSLFPL